MVKKAMIWALSLRMQAMFFILAVASPLLCLAAEWFAIFLFQRYVRGVPKGSVGFFHPYCDGGGGGERVLWAAVAKLIQAAEDTQVGGKTPSVIYIYTRKENVDRQEEILKGVKDRFGLQVGSDSRSDKQLPKIVFVPLSTLWLAEPKLFPVFTILGQSLGSMVTAFEGVVLRQPCETFIESTGFAFTFPIAKMSGATRILAYIHYPTMSNDMLMRVRMNVEMYNNSGAISKSTVLTLMKIIYYNLFLALYGLCGRYFADFIWCNSTWTRDRIVATMGQGEYESDASGKPVQKPAAELTWEHRLDKEKIQRLYPPVDLSALKDLGDKEIQTGPYKGKIRENLIISLAQFRPEKEQRLQILAYKKAMDLNPDLMKKTKFYMVGGTRPREAFPEDERLVDELKQMVNELKLHTHLEIKPNLPFSQCVENLATAKVAIHTMRDEHFGITLVEFLASRLITVCHASGGPRADIFTSEFSKQYLAGWTGKETEEELVNEMAERIVLAFSSYDTVESQAELDAEVKRAQETFGSNEFFGEEIRQVVCCSEMKKVA